MLLNGFILNHKGAVFKLRPSTYCSTKYLCTLNGNCLGSWLNLKFLYFPFLVLLGNPVLFSVSVSPLLLGLPVDAAVAAMCDNKHVHNVKHRNDSN